MLLNLMDIAPEGHPIDPILLAIAFLVFKLLGKRRITALMLLLLFTKVLGFSGISRFYILILAVLIKAVWGVYSVQIWAYFSPGGPFFLHLDAFIRMSLFHIFLLFNSTLNQNTPFRVSRIILQVIPPWGED